MALSDASIYPVGLNFLIFLLAGVLVWGAGSRLAKWLDVIAVRTGLGHAFVGMLFLGGITSLPELANVVTASASGNPPLAINNLLGSAALNVVLLAVGDAFIGRDAVSSVVAKPSTMMMGTLCILVLLAAAVAIAVGDFALGGILGIGSIVVCALSVGSFWLAAGYDERSPWKLEEAPVSPEVGEEADSTASVTWLWVRAAVAGAVIFAAGYTLSQTGDALARQTGLGSGIVGFVLISVATAMPEFSSIVAALRLHRYEMAFGQVFGTNFVNLSLFVIADLFFVGGPVINELGRFEIVAALLGAALIGIFMVGLLEHRNRSIIRMGYDSLAIVILFCGGLVLLARL